MQNFQDFWSNPGMLGDLRGRIGNQQTPISLPGMFPQAPAPRTIPQRMPAAGLQPMTPPPFPMTGYNGMAQSMAQGQAGTMPSFPMNTKYSPFMPHGSPLRPMSPTQFPGGKPMPPAGGGKQLPQVSQEWIDRLRPMF